jgi:hypothetical protein
MRHISPRDGIGSPARLRPRRARPRSSTHGPGAQAEPDAPPIASRRMVHPGSWGQLDQGTETDVVVVSGL